MIAVARWTDAKPNRHRVPGYPGLYKTDYTFAATGDGIPTAYLVDQSAECEVRQHYHIVEQFQLVISGTATFGRKSISAGFCHYAAPYTGYGPIRPGPEGLRYLTLRPRCYVPAGDQVAQYLPEFRQSQRLAHRRPRSLSWPLTPPSDLDKAYRDDVANASAQGGPISGTILPSAGREGIRRRPWTRAVDLRCGPVGRCSDR